MLTQDQTDLLVKLEVGSYSFNDLSEAEKMTLSLTLRPGPNGFTQQQFELLADWYLVVDDSQSLSNSLCPGLGLSLRETLQAEQVISASLLTDCRPGETWACIASQLQAMVLRKLLPEAFPVTLD